MVTVLLEWADGTLEQYDEVIQRMELGGKPAPGGVFHVCAPMEGGGIRIVDVWESPEIFERFAQEKIMPITQAVGIPPPSRMEVLPVHNALSR